MYSAGKGDDLKERPHRMSKLLRARLLKKVTAEQLRALVDELLPKQPEKPKASVSSASRSPEWDSKPEQGRDPRDARGDSESSGLPRLD